MVSFAEETEAPVTELNWSDVKGLLDQLGLEGDFVDFDEISIKMWLPADLKEVELPDKYKEHGTIGYYETGEDAEFLDGVKDGGLEYRDSLVRNYVEKIAVFPGWIEVTFKTGAEAVVEL